MSQMDADWTTARAPTGLTPESLAGQLDDFYAGRFADIARTWEVLERRDGSCAVGRSKRLHKIAGAARDWEVVAFDDSSEAEAQAEFLRGFYRRLRAESAIDSSDRGGFAKTVEFIADACGKQYSILARSYAGEGEALSITLKHVPMWFFRREKGVLEVCLTGAIQGVPLDPSQWLVANAGRGVMEAACITALWKRLPVRQLVNTLEKWGRPLVYGKTTAERGSAGWDQLMAALQALIGGWTGVLGGDATIEQIQAKLETSTLHMPWIEYCNREMTTLWLHSHLGTTAVKDTGSLAGGAQADDTDELIAADCVWLTDVLRTQLDAEALRLGMDVAEPLAGIQVQLQAAADDTADLDRIERGVKLGVPISVSFFRERFSLPEPQGDEELLKAPAAPASPFGMGADGGQPPEPPPMGRTPSGTPNMGAPAGTAEYRRAAAAPVGRPPAAPVPAVPAQALRAGASTPREMGNAAGRQATARQQDVDGLVAAALQPVGAAYAGLLQPLLESIAGVTNLARAEDLVTGFAGSPEARQALAERVAEAVFAAAMMGLEPDRPEIPGAVIGAGDRTDLTDLPSMANAAATYEPLPFAEARAFWQAKRLVADYADLEALDATWLQARALGFKVAGITERSALSLIKDELERGIRGEATVSELSTILRERFELNARHAEIVVRTNIQSAYQWGHYQQMTAPLVVEMLPIWAFVVVNDEATSDICRPLYGLAYRYDNPIWDSLYPPNHYNCRTTVMAMTAEDALDQGYRIMERWPRDPETGAEFMPQQGFQGNIGKVGLADLADGAAAEMRNANPNHDEAGLFASGDGAGGGKPLRETRVPVRAGVFTRLGIEPGNVFADYSHLQKKHPEYFKTPEEARSHVEHVLDNPTEVLPGNEPDHRLLVRSNGGHKAAALEIVKRGGKYRVKSAMVLTDAQMTMKRQNAGLDANPGVSRVDPA
jgi:SPP1 gp7 family putative phage head morphogenesis protein